MLNKIRLKIAFNKIKRKLQAIKDESFDENAVMDFLFSKKGSLVEPWQFEEEFLGLLKKYKALNSSASMEIGTANGGTLFAHCKLAANNATIISVDLPGGKFGGGYPDWKIEIYKLFAKTSQKLHLIRASSHTPETVNQVKNILNGKELDYLFIDGDHTYEGIKKDFDLYSPFVRNGGLIVFHDIADHPGSACKVDVFWNEIKQKYPTHFEFVNNPNQGQFGIGILVK